MKDYYPAQSQTKQAFEHESTHNDVVSHTVTQVQQNEFTAARSNPTRQQPRRPASRSGSRMSAAGRGKQYADGRQSRSGSRLEESDFMNSTISHSRHMVNQ